MVKIMHVLDDDTRRAMELFTTERSPFARRTYIRTVFAMIDGLTFQLKQIALERESEGFVSFSPDERDQLREETKFVKAPNNIRLSFDCLARAYATSFRADYGNHRWDSLRKAIAIRNSVTHPKKLEDLEKSDSDVETLLNGLKWYHDNISEVMRHCMIKLVDTMRSGG